MTLEQVVDYALSRTEKPAPVSAAMPPSSYPAGLSAWEAEVLKLVAKGFINAGERKCFSSARAPSTGTRAPST
jgi:hypothetical protein